MFNAIISAVYVTDVSCPRISPTYQNRMHSTSIHANKLNIGRFYGGDPDIFPGRIPPRTVLLDNFLSLLHGVGQFRTSPPPSAGLQYKVI